ncbi:ATP-binding protein [Dyella sp. KRB-257]|uniref:ATP-binding protein n=1 Tax=Dyella sp. KRB-257 TaxID=3400915 RepID=UPI003C04C6D6
MSRGSLRWRLLWLVIAALVAVLVPLGIISFRGTLVEVNELSDARLAQSARTIELLIREAGIEALHDDPNRTDDETLPERTVIPIGGHEVEAEVGFRVVDATGAVRMESANFASMPQDAAMREGFGQLWLGGMQWRTYTLHDPALGITILAGERFDSRDDITRMLWLDHALPLLLGLPLVAALVGWAVRRGLRPLDRLAEALRRRAPGSREPIDLAQVPLELHTVITALNDQLARLENALERERRFSADVAHELRTPITTSLISVETALGSQDAAGIDIALTQTQQALTMLARRVEQLLALARIEAGAATVPASHDLRDIAMEVIDELALPIADWNVELSLTLPAQPLVVEGFAAGLAALLRNLVENALRHVPRGGAVELRMQQQADVAVIEVIDNGPGIPPERRAEVFARFHREPGGRGDGYGLGLSIVQRVAQMHRAQIELDDAPGGQGLCVRVRMPVGRTNAGATADASA